MNRKMVPHGTWHGVCAEVKNLWYSRDDEIEQEVFDRLPDWMQPVEEGTYTKDRDNKLVCDLLKVRLTLREIEVIHSIFNDDLTMIDVGKEQKLTYSRVQQIRDKALRKMRNQFSRSPQVMLWKGHFSRWFEILEPEDKKKLLGEKKYYEYVAKEKEDAEIKRIENKKYWDNIKKLVEEQERIELQKKRKIQDQQRIEQINKRAKFLQDLDSLDNIMLRELRKIAVENRDSVVVEKITIILYCRKVHYFYNKFEKELDA